MCPQALSDGDSLGSQPRGRENLGLSSSNLGFVLSADESVPTRCLPAHAGSAWHQGNTQPCCSLPSVTPCRTLPHPQPQCPCLLSGGGEEGRLGHCWPPWVPAWVLRSHEGAGAAPTFPGAQGAVGCRHRDTRAANTQSLFRPDQVTVGSQALAPADQTSANYTVISSFSRLTGKEDHWATCPPCLAGSRLGLGSSLLPRAQASSGHLAPAGQGARSHLMNTGE